MVLNVEVIYRVVKKKANHKKTITKRPKINSDPSPLIDLSPKVQIHKYI